MFYQKLCPRKFVNLSEANNFVNLRFSRISHIIIYYNLNIFGVLSWLYTKGRYKSCLLLYIIITYS